MENVPALKQLQFPHVRYYIEQNDETVISSALI